MKLSILIPTVPQRELLFKELTTYLLWQIGELINKEVELIWDASPVGSMTTGEKRNKLLNDAKGDYVWFIDDDDWISDTAVKDILEGIKTSPDSFAINGTYTENGTKLRQWFISKDLEYCADYSTGVEVYLRPPNHITPMRRSISLQIGFPSKSYQEDFDFCMKLKESGLIKTEYKIDKPIYQYRFSNYNKLY
jgi:glycosyltransferase involved in cell wall biosynthesis